MPPPGSAGPGHVARMDIPGATVGTTAGLGLFGSAPQFSSFPVDLDHQFTSRSCSPSRHLGNRYATSATSMSHLNLATSWNCRLDTLLEYHMTYLISFTDFHDHLLMQDGPLPRPFRHYIAIMAATRHRCSFILEEQKECFLNAGGDYSWLDGYQNLPNKLQQLYPVNLILAHRPWLLEKHHIKTLLKNGWSLGQLTQAICILAHFHSLSSFIYGSGLEAACSANSNGAPALSTVQESSCSSNSPNSRELNEGGVDILVERMKNLNPPVGTVDATSLDNFDDVDVKNGAVSEVPQLDISSSISKDMTSDLNFTYIDFTRRGEKSQPRTLKSQDFSWEDRGYSVTYELYRDISSLLDNKFKTAYNMTYNTCGDRVHIDTFHFRRAVWNYLQSLHGIRHDDYDYSQVNKLIARNLKVFLKTVICYPERLAPCGNSQDIMKGFQESEKVHVLILVLEAKLQTELLYGLRALSQHLY